MKKIIIVVLIAILFLILSLLFTILNNKKTFKLIETYSTAALSKDIVYYPFSIRNSNMNIDSFAFFEDNIVHTNQTFISGYSSVVNVDSIHVLYDHLSVNSIHEVQNKLGQYCSYRNFQGIEILVFYNWYNSPFKLNVAIIKDENVTIISEEFDEENLFPIAIKKCENGVLILLRDNINFKLRKIDTSDCSVEAYNFTINHGKDYYYFVDVVYLNKKLYLMMNKLEQDKNKSSYLFTYDFEQNSLDSKKIGRFPVDFISGNNQSICYGMLTSDNIIHINRVDVFTQQQYEYIIVCKDDVKEIMPNSILYDGEYIYLNLTIEKTSLNDENHGVLYGYDCNEKTIVNRFLYAYKGSIFVKYFDKNTEYRHDALYATGY